MADEPRDRFPDKLFFRIGEVSRIVGVKPHVLRYWEGEFTALRPQKTPTNQRNYRQRDVELLLEIRRLLYEEEFTVAGARRKLDQFCRRPAPTDRSPNGPCSRRVATSSEDGRTDGSDIEILQEARKELIDLIAFLERGI